MITFNINDIDNINLRHWLPKYMEGWFSPAVLMNLSGEEGLGVEGRITEIGKKGEKNGQVLPK